jgi:hypothetical protein
MPLRSLTGRLRQAARRRRERAEPGFGAGPICVVAILKDEERFLDEWLAYHRLIGVDHFFLYDDAAEQPLRALAARHAEYVTVVDWSKDDLSLAGDTRQLRAYVHALGLLPPDCSWVSFIDGDEFIVLRKHASLRDFLAAFGRFGSVRLNWHVFGHNGHFDDPEGLVTAALTRRMAAPSIRTKSITRPQLIRGIGNAQWCHLRRGWKHADANGRRHTDVLYPGKTDVAHVNHYQCRSFRNWMSRVERGDVSFDRENVPPEHRWRLYEDECLRQFVETVAKDKNERVDEYMLRWEKPILAYLADLAQRCGRSTTAS